MDGLLIDTEPVWRAAEAEVFGELGIHLTEAELASTMGVPVEDVVALWRRRRPWPGAGGAPGDAEIGALIVDRVVAHVEQAGEPRPGVASAISAACEVGAVAIASSSPHRLIDAVCTRLGLGEIEIRCSAADEARGKPHPDVYLAAARRLGVPPQRCLAIEDSPNGVRSALAAGMRCIAVPDELTREDEAMALAHRTLGSLEEVTAGLLRGLLDEAAAVG